MICRHNKTKLLVLAQTVIFSLSLFCGTALAAPPEKYDVNPGSPGYMSAHTYLSPTDEPNIYRVKQTLLGTAQKQKTFTDLVILINTGHTFTTNTAISGGGIVGTDAFGFVLDPATGAASTTARHYGGTGYNIWNAMFYAAEEMINYIFDPTFNPNAENCRVAIVTYGNTATGAFNSPTMIGLTGKDDKIEILKKLGTVENMPRGGSNPVPLSKGVQAAYRLLEDKGTPLYFDPAGSGTTYYSNDFHIPQASGPDITTIPANEGAWETKDSSAPAGSKYERFIVSLHSIGATTTADFRTTTYPLSSTTPTPITDPNSPLTYNDSMFGMVTEGTSNGQFFAYNWARYNISEVSKKLSVHNNGKVPYQTFALWIDPDHVTINTGANGWMDFNDSISGFPLSQTPVFSGSGYKDYKTRINEMASGKGNLALYRYINVLYSPTSGPVALYENFEGMQYWSNSGILRNVYSTATLTSQLSDFISSITVIENSGTVSHSTLASNFELYKFQGEALLNPSYGTATNSGRNITWDIGMMPDEEISLTFYVRYTGPMDTGLSYPVFDESYVVYEYQTNSQAVAQCKYYSSVYISPDTAEVKEDKTKNDTVAFTSDVSASSIPSGLIPVQVGALNGGIAYTPSVTPAVAQISNETLQETNEAVPVTSEGFAWYILLVIPVASVVVLFVSRSKRKDSK